MDRIIAMLDEHPCIAGIRGENVYLHGAPEEQARARVLVPKLRSLAAEAGLAGGIMRFGFKREGSVLPDAYLFYVSRCGAQWDPYDKGYLFTRTSDNPMLGRVVESIDAESGGWGSEPGNLRVQLAPGWYVFQWRR